jgi:transcriptional regulator of arginine metabolism
VRSEQESRDRRHRAIRAILRRAAVRRQEDLVARLAEAGFEATQSSVSRDLRELGVVKVAGRYVAPEPEAGAPRAAVAEVAHLLRDVRPAGPHLTVVLTRTGAAPTVGLALDGAGWPEIVGTLAGDDTVFAATAGPRDQSRLLHRVRALMAGGAS